MDSKAFQATHVFVLDSGEEIPVRVELYGDYLAFEENETTWYTCVGPLALYWACRARGVTKLKAVREVAS